jgi:hypothetical protein
MTYRISHEERVSRSWIGPLFVAGGTRFQTRLKARQSTGLIAPPWTESSNNVCRDARSEKTEQ